MTLISSKNISETDIRLLPVEEAVMKSISAGQFASRELYRLRLLAENALLVVTTPSGKSTEPCPVACPEERRDGRRDAPRTTQVVEIPLNRIRLNSHQQSLSLDPAKLQKAIQRARLMGITPPIQARRVSEGYIRTDGLYRLRAAEALGLERIPALVE